MPLYRRLATRGFSNHPHKREVAIVNLDSINAKFNEGDTVDATALRDKGLIKGRLIPVKILGNGSIDKKITLAVDLVSAGAREKIEKAGGTIKTKE